MIERALPLALALLLVATPALAARGGTTQAQLDLARAGVLASPQSEDSQFELVVALARTPFLDQAWQGVTRLQGMDAEFASHIADRYEAAVVARPGDVEARIRLAFGYYFRGDRQPARLELERASRLAPEDPWIWDYLGYLYFEANKSDLAMQSWKKAVELDADNFLAHYLIAQLLFRQGHQRDAGEELAIAEKLRQASPLKP